MSMSSRFIGGLLLIVGTSIGGGMLALPVVNAASGFWMSSLFLIGCWLLMTAGAFFILEVNLYLPPGQHMPSMAYATLGRLGLIVTWVCYLLLMYVLLCAYISGGADVMKAICAPWVHLTATQSILWFTVLFGAVVYAGIHRVDVVNRALMLLKLTSYVLLIMMVAPSIQPHYLKGTSLQAVTGTLMILITSFGFAIIIPNLRTYFNDDLKKLKKVIWIGSFIPLICYLLWDAIIMGSVPTEGSHGLWHISHQPETTSALSSLLSQTLRQPWVTALFDLFTSVCMLTAFLGVALCLMSFLGDGFRMTQRGKEGIFLSVFTFIPPLVLVLYCPGLYLQALGYAGYLCVILLLFLPALMAFKGRSRYVTPFKVKGGRYTQSLVMLSACLICAYVAFMM